MILQSIGLDPAKLARDEALFHVANGYIGVRGNLEEGVPQGISTIRSTLINAYYDEKPIPYAEKMQGFPETQQGIVNVVDCQGIVLMMGEERFSPFEGNLAAFTRTLDMEAGLARREMEWESPQGKRIRVNITRMASFAVPELFVIRYEVESLNYAGHLRFVSSLDGNVMNFADPDDPRVASEATRHLLIDGMGGTTENAWITCHTALSALRMAARVGHQAPAGFAGDFGAEGGRVEAGFSGAIAPGQTVALIKYCVYTDERRHSEPVSGGEAILKAVRSRPLQEWMEAQRACLQRYWQNARVVIDGDDDLQRSLDFSVFSLFGSVGKDAVSNIGAKGLSGEGYEGHYFWDTEIYIFPFFLLTDLTIARHLLCYRHHILDAARHQARLLGHEKGALFPWRTIAGPECSGYFPSGSAQYHINGDIAHAFLQYYRATLDLEWMAEIGAEVLVETARLWLDAGHYVEGAFQIHGVTGPDEYTCLINNNCYTNLIAQENLRGAVEVMEALFAAGKEGFVIDKTSLQAEELVAFARAADAMYIPYDEAHGIHAQDDSFLQKAVMDFRALPPEKFPLLKHFHPLYLYRHQVCKQADTVLAHYLFGEDIPDAVMRRSFDYYEPLTTHDSSLSTCVFSIMAARLGETDKAMAYFKMSAMLDLEDAHGNTKDGIHTANMGGAYLCVVAGFAGLRLLKSGLLLRPRLPGEWKGYHFQFQYQGRRILCAVSEGQCALTLLAGAPLTVTVFERERWLAGTLRMPLQA
jgi:alpha,alpha-trehalose phosphorylase